MNAKRLVTLFLTLAGCASCGFRLSTVHDPVALHIPFCEGDNDGSLTQQVIQEIEKKGQFRYTTADSRYLLKVKIIDSKYNNIGYRYDQKKLKDGKKQLVANETRQKILAEIQIIDRSSEQVVIGPAHIEASCDFDHENYNIQHKVNQYSLGQLTDIDTAYEVTEIPLYRKLAQNIAIYLENNHELSSSTLNNM